MTDVILVYNSQEHLDQLGETSTYPVNFQLINSRSSKTNKDARKIKGYYAARQEPFAVVLDGEKPIKAFYSEAENVIESLIKYLKSYESTSNKQE